MNLSNPLSLKESIFSDDLKKYFGDEFSQFEKNFFAELVNYLYVGEYQATLVYSLISENIKNKNYLSDINTIGLDHITTLQHFLQEMSEEERGHSLLLEDFLSKKINFNITKERKQYLEDFSKEFVDRYPLLDVLLFYHLGECNFWTCLYLIYKHTQDEDIKKFFHKLLIDESKHFHNIFRFFKLAKNNIKINESNFLYVCNVFKFCNLEYIISLFQLPNNNSEKDIFFNKLVYNQEWQKAFNEIFMKKSFKTYNLLFPAETFESYFNKVNGSHSEWLYLKK
jgi:rubrerythrin